VIAAAKQAVDAALRDPEAGLKREDQLFRQTLGGAEAVARMQAFMDAGGQTRDVERGPSPF
jgi:hypothetical protein